MVGGGPFNLNPGEFTDDTSMSLALAESLTRLGRFDAGDQMRNYVAWRDNGEFSSNGRCFDIGGTVSAALRRFDQTGDIFAGDAHPSSAGNGSLMRLAPVPMFFAHNALDAIEMSGVSSRTTHGAWTCVEACRYFGGLIVGALRGDTKETILSELYHPANAESFKWAQRALHPEIEAVAMGSFKRLAPPEIKGTGFVVKSLEAALWAFHTTDNFRDCILKAANLGQDADTTAAIAGQLAGAFYGMGGIPYSWLEKLAYREQIEALSKLLTPKCNVAD